MKNDPNLDRFLDPDGPEKPAADVEQLAQRMVADGAIMTLPGCPVARYLVGHFAWLEPRRIFWFTAYGDSIADGHVLEFDSTCPARSGIYFSKDGQIAGSLVAIDQAGVDDPDDYRIAWRLWQEVAPLRAPMIENSCALLAGEPWRVLASEQRRQ